MSDRPVPEADAQEQDQPAGSAPAEATPEVGPEVPVADAIEQELPAAGPVAEGELTIPPAVPEADSIEQAQPGPLLDEDEGPR